MHFSRRATARSELARAFLVIARVIALRATSRNLCRIPPTLEMKTSDRGPGSIRAPSPETRIIPEEERSARAESIRAGDQEGHAAGFPRAGQPEVRMGESGVLTLQDGPQGLPEVGNIQGHGPNDHVRAAADGAGRGKTRLLDGSGATPDSGGSTVAVSSRAR